jgi:hypothetical protein
VSYQRSRAAHVARGGYLIVTSANVLNSGITPLSTPGNNTHLYSSRSFTGKILGCCLSVCSFNCRCQYNKHKVGQIFVGVNLQILIWMFPTSQCITFYDQSTKTFFMQTSELEVVAPLEAGSKMLFGDICASMSCGGCRFVES